MMISEEAPTFAVPRQWDKPRRREFRGDKAKEGAFHKTGISFHMQQLEIWLTDFPIELI